MLKLCVLLVVVTLSNVASAIPVTWEAHGVVRQVAVTDADPSTEGALTALGVEVGAPFTVRVSFNSDAPLFYFDYAPETGYAGPIMDMHVDFAHWSLYPAVGPAAGGGLAIASRSTDPDGIGNPLRSSIGFAGDYVDPTSSFPETAKVSVDWAFISDDPYFFSNTHLPVGVPDLAALPPYSFDPSDQTGVAMGPVLLLTSGQFAALFDVTGEITSVTIVPEPGAALLALFAVALILRRAC